MPTQVPREAVDGDTTEEDDTEEPPVGFISASEIGQQDIERMDKAVCSMIFRSPRDF